MACHMADGEGGVMSVQGDFHGVAATPTSAYDVGIMPARQTRPRKKRKAPRRVVQKRVAHKARNRASSRKYVVVSNKA
jgi:hypothetical protein